MAEEEKPKDEDVVTMGDLDTSDPDAMAESLASQDEPQEKKVETRKVTVGGQTLEVTPEVASALEAQQAEYEKAIRGLQQPAPQPVSEEEASWGDRMFADPEGFVKDLRADIARELRQEYRSAQRAKDFWETFYRQNDDLRKYNDIVESTLKRNQGTLGPMPAEAAAGKLADMTRDKIMGMVSEFGGKGGKSRPVESASSRSTKSSASQKEVKGEDEPNVSSLTDVLKKRSKARKEARGSTRTA